jgi:hypothetical protein
MLLSVLDKDGPVDPVLAAAPPRFLATHDLDGWKIKTYGIGRPRPELIEAARRQAAGTLPHRPDRVGAFGVGFLIIHDARDTCYALIDWWVGAGELHQQVFAAPRERPEGLAPLRTPAIGSVWELAVTGHERQAWLRHMLTNPAGPNLDAYLADTYTERQ